MSIVPHSGTSFRVLKLNPPAIRGTLMMQAGFSTLSTFLTRDAFPRFLLLVTIAVSTCLCTTLAQAAGSGACVIYAGGNFPTPSSPLSVGPEYAIKPLPIPNADLPTVRGFCSDAIFSTLMSNYCRYPINAQLKAQWMVATYSSANTPTNKICAASGCNSHSCVAGFLLGGGNPVDFGPVASGTPLSKTVTASYSGFLPASALVFSVSPATAFSVGQSTGHQRLPSHSELQPYWRRQRYGNAEFELQERDLRDCFGICHSQGRKFRRARLWRR